MTFQVNLDEKKYYCPDVRRRCHCISPLICPATKVIFQEKRFDELTKFKSCGFEGMIQLFCCPDYKPVIKVSEEGMTIDSVETIEATITATGAITTTTATTEATTSATMEAATTTTEPTTTTATEAEPTTLQLRQFNVRDDFNYLKTFREICGSVLNIRIFGGSEVEEHKYPWLVAIGYTSQLSRAVQHFFCGGVLISDQVKIVIDSSLS